MAARSARSETSPPQHRNRGIGFCETEDADLKSVMKIYAQSQLCVGIDEAGARRMTTCLLSGLRQKLRDNTVSYWPWRPSILV
jgi:hypothetical protein